MLGYGFDYDQKLIQMNQLKQNYHMYLYRKEDLGNQIIKFQGQRYFEYKKRKLEDVPLKYLKKLQPKQ